MITSDEVCEAKMAGVSSQLGEHDRRLMGHDHSINNLYRALNYRLPLWATFLLAAQTGVIGWLVK